MASDTISSPLVIAIDGPAAAGKGTLARRIAAEYNLAFLDTGMLYRGVAWLMLDKEVDPADAKRAHQVALSFTLAAIADADIRTRTVGAAASIVAANQNVRSALLTFQRRFASKPPRVENAPAYRGAVLDGRDIGTVVCPDATLKIFVTATAEARAHRRWLELVVDNPALREEQVLEDLKTRDARDAGRDTAPLQQAEDAHLIDTTHLSIDGAFHAAQNLIEPLLV